MGVAQVYMWWGMHLDFFAQFLQDMNFLVLAENLRNHIPSVSTLRRLAHSTFYIHIITFLLYSLLLKQLSKFITALHVWSFFYWLWVQRHKYPLYTRAFKNDALKNHIMQWKKLVKYFNYISYMHCICDKVSCSQQILSNHQIHFSFLQILLLFGFFAPVLGSCVGVPSVTTHSVESTEFINTCNIIKKNSTCGVVINVVVCKE